MKKDFTTKKTALFFIACLLIAALASAATYLGRDYAKETIQPIEATLLAEGAKKLCESGSSGKGPDNKEPWYGAYYTVQKPQNETEVLVRKASQQSQFTLTQASTAKRGLVEVDDAYIQYWYFADKDSSYTDLTPGKAKLSFALYNDTEHAPKNVCGQSVTVDDQHTLVQVNLLLPSYK
ncbi:MAG TPA: hypothetical protein VFO38_04245 [Candidatus Saccharimonadales bacterium]|nr:hypothetical protein [Candidatus Saccharimonadales bacterium]